MTPGAYAAVGAASALAGMFRSSISLVVIVVEGTGQIGALTPLIVGVSVANIIGPRVHGESFYDAQLRAKGVPFLRHHQARAPTVGDARTFAEHDRPSRTTFGARRVVASLVTKPPTCLSPAPLVAEVVDALSSAAHNGFPVVARDGRDGDEDGRDEDGQSARVRERRVPESSDDASIAPIAPSAREEGRLVGFVLRSQLMVLLARRAFVSTESPDFAASSDPESRSAEVQARVEATDAAMRTFHHRHHFGDRGMSCSLAAVERLGLSRREMRERLDLREYMKLAPLAVYSNCSAWRAAGYFISAGLRHLPVVDHRNRVVGVLTRRDLIPGFAVPEGSDASSEGSDAAAEKRPFSP